MLSKSAARAFFLIGTALSGGAFLILTYDTIQRVPAQTHQDQLTPAAIRGKQLWESSNCMGCHTLMGEGGYYAPELTKVYERRGEAFIRTMLKDPEQLYPGQRRMQNYHFQDAQIDDLVAFLKWIGNMDLNGFPPHPNLLPVAVAGAPVAGPRAGLAHIGDRPKLFNQVCIACHALEGQGGNVGPALDDVGDRRDRDYIVRWLTDPKAVKADSRMPKLPLSDADVAELAAFLSQLKAEPKS
ncbi:MAG: cytochrome c [Gammaproteobacteria bacterium]|nr:cytochrome c [Gammaproteobacteria bacterium]MBI5615039.1 cytochrome c [Gammaproteobacteria bacterium]